jgi:putative transposase
MDERVKFIARLLDGEAMSQLCEEFSISRKTGYKILRRYRDCGVEGLTDRSRRPYRHANQLPLQIETLIVRLKTEKPTWGRRRSGSASPGSIRTCTNRRSPPCMRFSTAMAW